jgi:prepilin-type N-terminal cleavage/methylation domain-containing protein
VTRREGQRGDGGATLIELLVALALFSVLGSMTLAAVVGARDASESTRSSTRLNEDARLALNRLGRELRQADAVTRVSRVGDPAATLPVLAADPSGARSLTLTADFNGNGVIEPSAVDPEQLTYTWDGQRLLLTAHDTGGGLTTAPVLAGHVTSFAIKFRSSKWQHDCDGDGTTVWTELDEHSTCAPVSAGVGDNSLTLTSAELTHIDSAVIRITVLEGQKRQDYQLQIDLRNAS